MRSVLLAALLAVAIASPVQAAPGDVLPDLTQLVPRGLVVKKKTVEGRRRFHLGFDSTAANVGAGSLTIHGYRRSQLNPIMRVDQLVQRRSGPPRLVRDVGGMQYVVHPDHRHWHLQGFEEYEIRSANSRRLFATDRKTGFCLGDRVPAPNAESIPNFSPVPLQGDTCGLGQPGLLGLFAGISPGWADRYAAHLEGQFVDVTRMASGTYVLVHWVNVLRRIEESDYENNASSTRFKLTWRKGRGKLPLIKVLRRCPGTITCKSG